MRTRPSREQGPQGPRLSSPAERERSAAKDGGTGGQYVAVFVQSPTHLSIEKILLINQAYFMEILVEIE